MPTNAELTSQLNSLQTQLTQLLKIVSTKDDLKDLATKEDIKDVVKKADFDKFKEDFAKELREELDTRFATFKSEQKATTDTIATRVNVLEDKLEAKLVEISAKRLLDEKYNFRYNFLMFGKPEREGGWNETPQDCLNYVMEYLGKMIPDPSEISIVDCHRYGKKPDDENAVTLGGKKRCRPIIFKVQNYFNVRTINDNLSNLKTYFINNPTERKVYFRRHIPKSMYLQRKELQPKFTELYKADARPKWQLDIKTAKYYIVDKHGVEIRE